MSRKLPQAIGQTLDQMRSSAVKAARGEPVPGGGSGPSKACAALVVTPSGAASDVAPPAAPRADPPIAAVSAQRGGASDGKKTVQMVLGPDSVDHAGMLRRSRGRELIERHAKYAAFSGLIPLPVVDVAGVTATVLHMAGALARLYGVAVQRDRTRAIVMGLLAGSGPVGLGALASSGLARLVPGANLLGIAVTSITAAACTRSIGMVFLEHFESGGTLLDFKVEQGKAALEAAHSTRSKTARS